MIDLDTPDTSNGAFTGVLSPNPLARTMPF